MIAGPLLAPPLVQATSLRASFVILGAAAIGVTLLGRLGHWGWTRPTRVRSTSSLTRPCLRASNGPRAAAAHH